MSLEERGYTVFRKAISPTRVEKLVQEVEHLFIHKNRAGIRNPVQHSVSISDLAHSPEILTLLPATGLKLIRSLLFNKTPEVNWPVAWHQDRTISVQEKIEVSGYGPWTVKEGIPHVQPPITLLENMATVRVHLDPAPSENGALHVIPGSHNLGFISREEIPNHIQKKRTIIECDPGDILVMRPLLLHSSKRSQTPKNRRILHFEYAPKHLLPSPLRWSE